MMKTQTHTRKKHKLEESFLVVASVFFEKSNNFMREMSNSFSLDGS